MEEQPKEESYVMTPAEVAGTIGMSPVGREKPRSADPGSAAAIGTSEHDRAAELARRSDRTVRVLGGESLAGAGTQTDELVGTVIGVDQLPQRAPVPPQASGTPPEMMGVITPSGPIEQQ